MLEQGEGKLALMRSEETGGFNEEEKLLDSLQQLSDRDPTSTIHLVQNDNGLLEFLLSQTSSKKKTTWQYPTLVIVDTTCKALSKPREHEVPRSNIFENLVICIDHLSCHF
ncbi:uncharacterized protein LOC127749283 [Frankliniella occidentalis]|uniref:Uncharacterized protein LOC127749283 n=1 Tax=Frankliniella occidentalis TaxID=133901 RepID=A0A9C6U7R4_FRAOC|nr:uncharacterized protein LOC127749283 [Frankliniella occidentalis]